MTLEAACDKKCWVRHTGRSILVLLRPRILIACRTSEQPLEVPCTSCRLINNNPPIHAAAQRCFQRATVASANRAGLGVLGPTLGRVRRLPMGIPKPHALVGLQGGEWMR